MIATQAKKNYKLAATQATKTTSLPPHGRNTKLQPCRPTGVIQTTKLFFFSTPPHRRNTKLLACCHTGMIQNTSLPPHRRNTKQQALSLRPYRQQNFFLSFFFLFRHHTGVVQNYKLTATLAIKLQACHHTGEIQKRQVYCNTGKTSYRLSASHACYPTNKMKKLHAYCPTDVKGKN